MDILLFLSGFCSGIGFMLGIIITMKREKIREFVKWQANYKTVIQRVKENEPS